MVYKLFIIVTANFLHVKKAANGVASSAFTFQGQKCSACSRAIVLADVYDEFVDEVVKCAAELKANQGSGESNAAMGPVINQGAYNSITNYIEIGRKEGNVVFGGTYSDAEGYYIDPTVIRDIKRDARIANEEIFGPVLAVIKVDSFDEALDVANQTEYGLTGSVYSETRENIQTAKQIIRITCWTLCIKNRIPDNKNRRLMCLFTQASGFSIICQANTSLLYTL